MSRFVQTWPGHVKVLSMAQLYVQDCGRACGCVSHQRRSTDTYFACPAHPCLQALESSLAEAFEVARQHQTFTITSTLPSGGDVGDVWAAMELAGLLSKHMQSVAGKCLRGWESHCMSLAAGHSHPVSAQLFTP